MFRTSWDSGRYISTSRFSINLNLSGSWKLKLAKPEIEGTPTVGTISTQQVCTGEILLYQFTTFLYLAESDGWVQQKHSYFYQNIVFECVVPSATLVRPIVRNMLGSHYSKTCPVRCFTTPVILPNPDPINCLAKWLNGSKSCEFNLGFWNSVF